MSSKKQKWFQSNLKIGDSIHSSDEPWLRIENRFILRMCFRKNPGIPGLWRNKIPKTTVCEQAPFVNQLPWYSITNQLITLGENDQQK